MRPEARTARSSYGTATPATHSQANPPQVARSVLPGRPTGAAPQSGAVPGAEPVPGEAVNGIAHSARADRSPFEPPAAAGNYGFPGATPGAGHRRLLCRGPRGSTAGLVPWLVTGWEGSPAGWDAVDLLGVVVGLVGLAMVLACFVRFVREGRGTPAPIAPTAELVVGGLYRYLRNPMYVGVGLAIAGQCLAFRSLSLVVWLALFTVAVTIFVSPTSSRRCARGTARPTTLTAAASPRSCHACVSEPARPDPHPRPARRTPRPRARARPRSSVGPR